jgi:argininosuccinate synthase
MRRVLLADAGDIDFAAVVPALAERYAASVVTLTLDVGQLGYAASSRSRALAAGAVRAHLVDVREEFAREGLLRLLHAGALRADDVTLPAALLRTLTAAKLLEVAAMEGTTLVAHGAAPGTAAATHMTRLITAGHSEAFVIAAGAPPAGASPGTPGASACLQSTLWWRQYAGSGPSGPSVARVDSAAQVDVAFAAGVPVSLNGVEMPLLELIEAADTIAGDHGIGRFTGPHPYDSPGPETVIHAPAAAVLVPAHAALARAAASRTLTRLRRHAALRYAALVPTGEWMSDAREALDALFAHAQRRVTGTVRLQLTRGRCRVLARTVTADAPGSPSSSVASAPRSEAANAQFVSH